jgi:hypothetical protein
MICGAEDDVETTEDPTPGVVQSPGQKRVPAVT